MKERYNYDAMRNRPPIGIFTLLSILVLIGAAACSGGASASRVLSFLSATSTLTGGFVETSVSPDQGVHQGYATDGTYHYLLDTTRIFKRDSAWNTVQATITPLAGLSGINHLGDGDYHNGSLYIAGERYANCGDFSHQSIIVFDAATLNRQRVVDVSAQGMEVSGVVVVPEQNAIYVSSFCDGSKLWKYDLGNFAPLGTFALAPPVTHIQGVAYRSGIFYLSQNEGTIFSVSAAGTIRGVYSDALNGVHEGLDYSQGELRWLIDAGSGQRKIHFLKPN